MSILDALQIADASKVTRSPTKFGNLGGAMKAFVESWPNQSTFTDFIRASGAYFVCPREFILNYWQPQANKFFDTRSQLMMSTGSHLHEVIQDRILGPAGVLKGQWVAPHGTHFDDTPSANAGKVIRKDNGGAGVVVWEGYHPQPRQTIEDVVAQRPVTWHYQEYKFFEDLWRISGHTDGVVSVARINWLSDNIKLVRDDPDAAFKILRDIPPGEEALLEIKTTNSYSYKQLTTGSGIADYYKMQAAIYQKLTGLHQTVFWYLCRDTMDSKIVVYDYEPGWWNQITRKCRVIWEAIRDETLPDVFMACKTPTDKRAKGCVFQEPCWKRQLDFARYVSDGKAQAAAAGRDLLDLTGKTWPLT